MSRKREVGDKRRNNIFAAAFDELRRNHNVTTQQELAKRMGVSKDTITNIMRYRTEVTEDIITKLQTASGCIFNLQWLRGESDVMLAEDLEQAHIGGITSVNVQGSGSLDLMNTIIVAKDEEINSLKRELKTKDETIVAMRNNLADKDLIIREKNKMINVLQRQLIELSIQKGLSEDGYPFVPGVAEEGTHHHGFDI